MTMNTIPPTLARHPNANPKSPRRSASRSSSFKRWALVAGLSLFSPAAIEAATWNWVGNTTGNWGAGTSWVEGTAAADNNATQLIFGGTADYTATNNLGTNSAANNINSITTNNTAGTITIARANTRLTILSGTAPAINFNGAGNLTISAPLLNNTTASLQGSGTGTLLISDLRGRNGGRTLNVNLPNAAAVTISSLQISDNTGTGTQTYVVANATPLSIGTILIGVADTGNFTKSDVGTLTITGAGTYNGATLINAGIVNIRNATSLGTVAGGTTVASGATLQLQAGITVGAESLTLGGTGAAGQQGALVNVSGTNNFGGALTLSADTSIASLAGTFNLTNTAPLVGGGFALTLTGATGGTLSTTLDNSITGFTKNGAGTWDLGGTVANTFTGTIFVNGGNLRPNKTADVTAIAGNVVVGDGSAQTFVASQTSNQFASTSIVTINGTGANAGIFRINNTNQTIGGLVSTAGQGVVESNGATGGTLTLANSTPYTFEGVIRNGAAGPLAITLAGTSSQTLTGTNTYTGKTTVTSGTLIQGSAAAFGNSSAFAVVNGGVLDASLAGLSLGTGKTLTAGRTSGSGTDILGNVTLTSGATLEVSQPVGLVATAGTFTQDGNLALDSASLKFSLSNVTTVGSGINDLVIVQGEGAGNLTLNGTINVDITGLSGPLVAGNYTLFQYTGTLTGDATNFAQPTGLVPGRSSYSYDTTSTPGSIFLTVTGNAGNLTWIGNGTTNVWDKTTSGVFTGASPDQFFDGDIVSFTDAGSANPTVNLAETVSPFSLNVTSASDYTLTGVGSIAGTTGINHSGTGTLKIQTANTYTGVTNVTAGAISVENATALGATTGNTIVSNGAQVQFNNSGTAEPFAINGTGIAGSGALRNFAGANTLSGLVTLQSDSSIVNADTSNALTLDVATGNAITGTFGLTIGGAGNTVINDPIAIGSATLTKTGTGILTVGGASNTNTGLTSVLGGSLILNKTAAANAVGGNLTIGNGTDAATVRSDVINQLPDTSVVTVNANGVWNLNSFSETIGGLAGAGSVTLGGATLSLNAATTSTFDGVISGAGGISRLNGGTLILNTAQTYTGSSNIQGANSQIRIAVDNALPVGTTLTFAGTTNTGVVFDLNGKNQTIAALTAATNGAGEIFIQNNSGSGLSILTITNGTGSFGGANPTLARLRDNGGVAGGTLGLTITGGTTIFKDLQAYSGPTTISGGTYQLALNNAVAANSAFSITGTGVLELVSFNAGLDNLTGNGTINGTTGVLTVTTGSFSGLLTGGIGVIKGNAGGTTLTLSNTANTFTGTLQSSNGTLEVLTLADSGAGSNGTGNIRLVNGTNTATLKYSGTGSTTSRNIEIFGNGTGGNAVLNSSGAGALQLSGTVTATGTGTAKILTLAGSNTDLNTLSGVISNGTTAIVSVVKNDAGTWKLSGTNTYTGTTTVSAGRLVIDGDNSAATGAISVAAGATLSGSGIVGGLVTLDSGATVAPGNSPGNQTFAGGLNLSAGGVYEWQLGALSELNPGIDYDTLTVAGSGLTLDGTSTLLIDTTALVGTGPNSGHAFWTTPHTWTIATSNSIVGDFAAITNGSWASGTFDTSISGGNVLLSFTPVAIPEPSTLVLGALGGLGFAGWSLRRRRAAAKKFETV